jgi:hypothetical protein
VYEARYEDFGVTAPNGQGSRVRFQKAGVLAAGDQPEIFLFEVDGCVVKVAISGEALRQFQQANRYLSREEKVDLAGLCLKMVIERGGEPVAGNLLITAGQLAQLARELGLFS